MNIGVIHENDSDFNKIKDKYCDYVYTGDWNVAWDDARTNTEVLLSASNLIFDIKLRYNNSFNEILSIPNLRIIKVLSDDCSDDQNLHHCSLADEIIDFRVPSVCEKSGAHITTCGRVGSHILSDYLNIPFSHEHRFTELVKYKDIYTIVRRSFLDTVASNIIIGKLEFKSKFLLDEDDRYLMSLPHVNWEVADVNKRFSDLKYFYDLYVYLAYNGCCVQYTEYEEFSSFYNSKKPKFKKHPYNKADVIVDYDELNSYLERNINPVHNRLLANLHRELAKLHFE